MSCTDPLQRASNPWADLLGMSEAEVSPSPIECNSAPQNTSLSLPTEDDILEGVFWRLSKWTTDEVDAGSARLARLLEMDVPLNTAQPEVAAVLAQLPKDRRLPWTGLMALAVLHADVHGDWRLFFLAGIEVMAAYRQAKISKERRSGDALSRKIDDYLGEMSDIATPALWEDFTTQAQEGWGETLVDGDDDSLSFESQVGAPIKTIGRAAFFRRVQRARNERQQPANVVCVG